MLRMEIALFLVVGFISGMYFTAEKEASPLHKTFSALLAAVLTNLALDGITVYTVNHLDTVPEMINGIVHRLFLGTMVMVLFLFYWYIAILVQEETGKARRLDTADSLEMWGVRRVYRMGFGVQAAKPEQIPERIRERIHKKTDALARRIQTGADKTGYNARAKKWYYIVRMMHRAFPPAEPDYGYWESRGWHEKGRPWKSET